MVVEQVALKEFDPESFFKDSDGNQKKLILIYSQKSVPSGPQTLKIYSPVFHCEMITANLPIRFVKGFNPNSLGPFVTTSYEIEYIIDDDTEPYFMIELSSAHDEILDYSHKQQLPEVVEFILQQDAIPIGDEELERIFIDKMNGASATDLTEKDYYSQDILKSIMQYIAKHSEGGLES